MLNSLKKKLVKSVLSRVNHSTWSYFWSSPDLLSEDEAKSKYPEISLSKETPLCVLMNEEGSDKGIGWHNYTRVYHHLFSSMDIANLFEMGIGSTNPEFKYNMGEAGRAGASVYAWKKYFSNANVYAADLDESILISADRIKSFACDQTSLASIQTLWENPEIPQEFDVMIDDGLHEFFANHMLFENSIHKLRKGGIYCVEDIHVLELGSWKNKIENDYVKRFPNILFRLMVIPNLHNGLNNNLLVAYRL